MKITATKRSRSINRKRRLSGTMRCCKERRNHSCSIRHIQAHSRRDQYVFAATLSFVSIWLALSSTVREAHGEILFCRRPRLSLLREFYFLLGLVNVFRRNGAVDPWISRPLCPNVNPKFLAFAFHGQQRVVVHCESNQRRAFGVLCLCLEDLRFVLPA